MSDLSGFTEELDQELRSYSDQGAVDSACPHRLIYSGFCAECAPTFISQHLRKNVSPALGNDGFTVFMICSCYEPVDQGKESERAFSLCTADSWEPEAAAWCLSVSVHYSDTLTGSCHFDC